MCDFFSTETCAVILSNKQDKTAQVHTGSNITNHALRKGLGSEDGAHVKVNLAPWAMLP